MALCCLLHFQRGSLWLSLAEVHIDMVKQVWWGYQFFLNFSATTIAFKPWQTQGVEPNLNPNRKPE